MNSELRARTLALLGSVWRRLPDAAARARGWGADWFAGSRALVRASLAARAPVSRRCGALGEWLALIDLALQPEVELAAIDGCVVAYQRRDGVLRLHDLIAPAPGMVPLDAIARRLGGNALEV